MSDNLRWYTKAIYGMDHVARGVPAGAWDRASPCEGWTARDVLGHVIGIQTNIAALARGAEGMVANPMVDPGRLAGDDPAATWAVVRDDVLEALDHPGVLHRMVPWFSGPAEMDGIVGFNCGDTTIHSWDLARATGGDDRLDAAMVDRVTAALVPRLEQLRGPMIFGPEVAVADGADPQTRLLALSGRHP